LLISASVAKTYRFCDKMKAPVHVGPSARSLISNPQRIYNFWDLFFRRFPVAQTHSLRPLFPIVLATFALAAATFGQAPQAAQKAAKAPSKSQVATPVTMTECEGVNNCATWTFLGAQGNGQWPSGEVANLSVEHYDDDNVVIRRADSTGSSAGLTAVYTGTRHGDRVGGEFTSSWPGHWENKSGNWYATLEKKPQGPPSIMRICPLPITVCSTSTWNNGHFDFRGDNGITGTITVISFTPESVILNRADYGRTAGYSAAYTGQISSEGNRILNGDWSDSNGNHGHFTAAWGAAIKNLPASTSAYSLPPSPIVVPVVCVPWFFGMVCGR
jgi:hypothetical protein